MNCHGLTDAKQHIGSLATHEGVRAAQVSFGDLVACVGGEQPIDFAEHAERAATHSRIGVVGEFVHQTREVLAIGFGQRGERRAALRQREQRDRENVGLGRGERELERGDHERSAAIGENQVERVDGGVAS